MNLTRTYETLLRLYPERHKTLFAQEMLTVFEEAAGEYRKRGWLTFVAFALREVAGLLAGSTVERLSGFQYSPSSTPYHNTRTSELQEAEERVTFTLRRMEYAIAHHQFEKARSYSNQEFKAREKLQLLKEKHEIQAET